MKKFISTKTAAPLPLQLPLSPSPSPSPSPPPLPAPNPVGPPASPVDPTSTFATFEALLQAANPAEHPSSAKRRTIGASNRSVGGKARPPLTPIAPLTFDFPCPEVASGGAPSASSSTPSLASPPSATPASTTSTTTGIIKMCGYLKKKRNKMGGWRKLFFILQNQLLLSYSSRDDYEKKLAPFKDIINLVPGTMIIPTTGPRFTIETNSKVMYTFRCDDQGSCSEWIMALLDSLNAVNGGLNNDRTFSPQNIFQRSTLPLASIALPPQSKLFDRAIQRSSNGRIAALDAPPKPPRSFTTDVRKQQPQQQQQQQQRRRTMYEQEISDDALNNNLALSKPAAADGGTSVSSSGSGSNSSRASSSIRSKILAFESHANLHQAREPVPPQDDDTKENIGGLEASNQSCIQLDLLKPGDSTEGVRSSAEQPEEEGQPGEGAHDFDGQHVESDRWKWWLRGRQSGVKQQQQQEEACPANAGDDGQAEGKVEQPEGGEEAAEERKQQQQIFRLHPDVWRKTHQSMDVCRINSMFGERTPEPIGRQESQAMVAGEGPGRVQIQQQEGGQANAADPGASSCSALPSVTVEQHEQRGAVENLYGAPPESSAVYADVRDYRKSATGGDGDERRDAPSEPIYAVVDMCAKRTRRAARQRHPEAEQPGRIPYVSVSLPQIPSSVSDAGDAKQTHPVAKRCYSNNNNNNNNDYEDVSDFLDRFEAGECGGPVPEHGRAILSGDDHIYEPILVPERMIASDTSGSSTSLPASSSSGQHSSIASSSGGGGGVGGGLWKKLKRMHLQGSRHRQALRQVFAGGHRAADGTASAVPVRQTSSEGEADPGRLTVSALEGLGRRLDSHRRSIKKRIRSLYERGGAPVPAASSTASSCASDDVPRSEGTPADPFGRAQASRQSRKSLSLDSFLVGGRAVGRTTPRLLIETTAETK